MSKVRLTREQSRDQTRQRLLDAAQSIFLTKGFVAASVEDIAELAGYTRGAFYSNFASKSELFLQLLKRDHENVMSDMRAIFEAGETRQQMEDSVLHYYSNHFRDNECFLLWMEAKLQAARDPEFRIGFIACMGELRDATTEYIRQFSERVGTPLPLPARELAIGLLALSDGMQFSFAFDPQNVSAETTESVLAGFFRRVVFGERDSG
ncbi:TetR/AcrR family transcriptional regulator [Achromobacter xylosoxidans]|jgi:AcrR family transcriptional regulator|uniref:TetR/AcrR family transcriptional regulator n=1 Tax=Alcaligenes xylosoxydans xylosoxydans TaxID=85698 RepID=A0A0D6GH59_ALCXX|nr:TetR/AcrR family transcriptional regulator [Achromobacter xylosoxidans]AHC45819.1 Transcriptional regulator, TetR family [Achromobacter xylosoxidans NBRC 15126 = ATCC 27061]AUZ19638.1 TetR/AcrR family transcriptional regulator [Achromobacter xylosoxidans]AXA76111.1 DNA-binding transcriptional repressor AcrR [Achromobacter xylosoxidans]KAA5921605.1 TetR/AcrR family transcriptional regulator [Achromobacter xylosoxidans]KMJ90038.1 TetR family transcriptional regulator [Achromobacter xylosoxida